jgi:two-component system, NtrC family, sensor kinase
MDILILDDDASARETLRAFLTKWEFSPVAVSNGEEAWRLLQEPDGPSLAILDWMMPGMNGLDVLQALRQAELTRYVYAILLTGRQDEHAMLQGFEAGADDFVHKPFDARELQSRINVGARMIRMEREVRHYARDMEALARERAAQLLHADRLSSLGTMAAGIAHEINNPTSVLFSAIDMLLEVWKDIQPAVAGDAQAITSLPDYQRQFIQEEIPGILTSCESSLKRIAKIVNSLQVYARKGSQGTELCDLNKCVEDAVALCSGPMKRYVEVRLETTPDLPPFLGDQQAIHQVIINLVMNASQAMEGRKQPSLTIRTSQEEHWLRADFEDNGPGIPDETIQQIWTPFFTTKDPGKGTGLGLAIAQSIMEKHGGAIRAENPPEGGARFTILFPPARLDESQQENETCNPLDS